MKRYAPVLLAVAVGAVSGLLGAMWPAGESAAVPAVPEVAALPAGAAEGPAPRVLLSPKLPPHLEVAVFCNKVPVKTAVQWRRFEQSTQARKWGAPLAADASPTAGLYLLTARAPGCVAKSQTLEVKEGVTHQRIELFLEQGHAIAGTVRDSTTKQPVGGALVSARQLLDLRSKTRELSPEDDAFTAVADAFGRYRLDAIADGELVVRASAEGFGDGKATIKLAGADAQADLDVEPNGFITGRVTGFDKAATIKDLREDGRSVFANADGTFRIAAGAGPHLLMGEDASGATGLVRVNVPAKETISGVELVLAQGGKIKGTAAINGLPATCARVWVRAESDPYEIASAQVAADGSFSIEKVPAGRPYWLFGECPNGEHGDLLGVEPNRAEPVELTLKQAAGLVVQVIDPAGLPVANVEVEVSQPSREPAVAVTDARGYAELSRLLAAVVTVDARRGSQEATQQSVQLIEGQPVAMTIRIVDIGTISGRIEGAGGLNAGVVANHADLQRSYRERVNADGAFAVRVVPGHYKVFPWNRGFHGFEQAQEVDVVAGQEVRVDFALPKPGGQRLNASSPGTVGASFDDSPGGVAISFVISDGPIAKAGLRSGDLLLAIDGQPLSRSVDAFRQTSGQPGTPVRIAYRRGGADAEVVVTRAGGGH